MRRLRILPVFAAAASLAVVLLQIGPVYSNPPERKEPQKAVALNAAFDYSHAEIFRPEEDGPLNYSSFYRSFKASGGSAAINNEKITKGSLEGINVYVIAGPSKEVMPDEVEALKAFVNGGGSLLVLLHISKPAARLTESFGIVVSNFVIAEGANRIKGVPQDFYVNTFIPHPVTDGLKKVAIHGAWGLMAVGGTEIGAKVVAETSPKAWADINRNRRRDRGETLGSYGIIAVSRHGKGKVVVVADDAPFANKFIKEADNGILAENILRWFASKSP